RAGADRQHSPGSGRETERVVELGQQSGCDQRRLARAGRSDRQQKMVLTDERQEVLDLVVAAVEEPGILLAKRDHPGIWTDDGLKHRRRPIEQLAEPGDLVIPTVRDFEVEPDAEAESQG